MAEWPGARDKGPFFYDLALRRFIELRDRLTFGRSEGDIKYPDDGLMSRVHLMVHVKPGGSEATLVEDVGSRNGTVINAKKIAAKERIEIKDGDIIEVGDQIFCFSERQTIPPVTYSAVKKLGHQRQLMGEVAPKEAPPAPITAPSPALTPAAATLAPVSAPVPAMAPTTAPAPTAESAPAAATAPSVPVAAPAAPTAAPVAAPAAAPAATDRLSQSTAEGKSITRSLLRPPRVQVAPLDGVLFTLAAKDGAKIELKVANLSVSGVGFMPDDTVAWPPLNEPFPGLLSRKDDSFALKLKIVRKTGAVIGCTFVEAAPTVREKIGSWFTLEFAAAAMLDNSRNLPVVRTESLKCHQFIGDNGCELYYALQDKDLIGWHVAFFGQRLEYDMSPKVKVTSEFVKGTINKEKLAAIMQDATRFVSNVEGLSETVRAQMLKRLESLTKAR